MEEELLDLIYEAAIDIERWPAVGERLADAVGGGVAALVFRNHATGEGAGIPSRMCASELDRVWGYFANRNPLLKITDLPARPRVLTDEEKLPKSELVRTEYYNEFLRRNEMHSLLMARLAVWDDNTIVLNVGRRAGLEPFGRREIEIANSIHPHLVRACRLAHRLTGMRAVDGGLREIIERSPSATLLVDSAARVQHANAAAETLLHGKPGLTVERGALRAETQGTTRELHRLIGRAATARGGRASGALSVERQGKRPLSAIVNPLLKRADPVFGPDALALVCISDPERKIAGYEGRLRELFGFTAAESRLAVQLLNGTGLKMASSGAKVSINTARTHLAHIFEKTGVKRQSELIRLLMLSISGPAN